MSLCYGEFGMHIERRREDCHDTNYLEAVGVELLSVSLSVKVHLTSAYNCSIWLFLRKVLTLAVSMVIKNQLGSIEELVTRASVSRMSS